MCQVNDIREIPSLILFNNAPYNSYIYMISSCCVVQWMICHPSDYMNSSMICASIQEHLADGNLIIMEDVAV